MSWQWPHAKHFTGKKTWIASCKVTDISLLADFEEAEDAHKVTADVTEQARRFIANVCCRNA